MVVSVNGQVGHFVLQVAEADKNLEIGHVILLYHCFEVKIAVEIIQKKTFVEHFLVQLTDTLTNGKSGRLVPVLVGVAFRAESATALTLNMEVGLALAIFLNL